MCFEEPKPSAEIPYAVEEVPPVVAVDKGGEKLSLLGEEEESKEEPPAEEESKEE
jgi:hypothetical protein